MKQIDWNDIDTWCVRVGSRYEVVRDMEFDLGGKSTGDTLLIPAGFRFEVSIPRWLTWLFDPHDVRYLTAACWHDFALLNKWDRKWSILPFADGLLKNGKVNWMERFVMITGVRLGARF